MGRFVVTIKAPGERPREVNTVPKRLATALEVSCDFCWRTGAVSQRIVLIKGMDRRLDKLCGPGCYNRISQ